MKPVKGIVAALVLANLVYGCARVPGVARQLPLFRLQFREAGALDRPLLVRSRPR